MGIYKNSKRVIRNFIKISNEEFKLKKKNKIQILPTSDSLTFSPSASPKVSIIIPFYSERNFTLNCLNYLHKNLSQKHPYEIILIDDNSPDDCDFSNISGVTIIKNEENLGFLKNINKGIEHAKGEYIYILNNDTEVQQGFLDELFYVFENFENVGAVGSMLLNANRTLQEGGSVFIKDFDIRQITHKILPFYPEVNYIHKVDYCSGCSLLFKKYDDNQNTNFLDTQFAPAYFEETDFCFQLKHLQKKDVYYTPFSKVIHFNGVSYNAQEKKSATPSKKELIFRTNKESFGEKWKKELEDIKAKNIGERIQELYQNKSILVFTSIVPEHDKDSGSNRLFEIINSFLNLGFHITLFAKERPINDTYKEFYQRKGVMVYYDHKKINNMEKFILEQGFNSQIAWFYNTDIFSYFYPKVKKVLPKAKIVFDMVDIHHLRFKRALELEPKRNSLKREYKRTLKGELNAAKLCDFLIGISDEESTYMERYCLKEKIKTISNVHYTRIDIKETPSFQQREGIVFIGSTHTPNVDALYFLYNDIMPLIWKENPNIKVHVIGKVSERISDISHPNFIFHGYVKDIVPLFMSSKFMIAPLRYGAGVKGKIGQAFEYYLPVVTSKIGAEGMNLVDKKNALLCETAQEYATSTLELYKNETLWKTLQSNSESSLEPFSKKHLTEQITQIIESD
ncbi:MAG: hypothetical protein C4K58_04680 [Flavobacteriaceae bacterium]|nr:MAG: hypothetical protein C4K58_04680 [Flavobacteriaceae bacterium]